MLTVPSKMEVTPPLPMHEKCFCRRVEDMSYHNGYDYVIKRDIQNCAVNWYCGGVKCSASLNPAVKMMVN